MKHARFASFLLLPAFLLFLGGCKKNIQSNEAVKKGVIEHLSKNSGLQISGMDIEVSSVTYRDNEADALMSFKPKGGDAASGMQMRYTLERKGNEWVVKSKADSGMGHGGAMPPAGAAGEMPPGHPPTGSGAAPDTKK